MFFLIYGYQTHAGVLAAAKSKGKWGFINKKGEWVIPPVYDYVEDFYEGLAVVANFDKPLILDDSLGIDFTNQGYFGFIDEKGNEVLPLKYGYAEGFSGGLALVNVGGIAPVPDNYAVIGGKWIYMDKKGTEKIEVQCELATSFRERLAAVVCDNRVGYIDPSGKWTIKPQYAQGYKFYEGKTAATIDGEFYVVIDNKGKTLSDQGYLDPPLYREGKAKTTTISQMGYLDKKGRFQPVKGATFIYDYHENMAKFEVVNQYIGYLNKKGKVAIVPLYGLSSGHFSSGLAYVEVAVEDTSYSGELRKDVVRYGYINKKGIFRLQPGFLKASDFNFGRASVVMEGRQNYVLINKKGSVKSSNTFSFVGPFHRTKQ